MIELATSAKSALRREAPVQHGAPPAFREARRQWRYRPSANLERFLRSKYLEQPGVPLYLVPAGAPPMADTLTSHGRIAPPDRGPARRGIARSLRTVAKLVALALTLLLFGAIAFEDQAHASPILAEAGAFIGQTAAQYSMNVTSAGTLTVNLIDYGWPSPLTDLTLEIASPTKILGQLTGAGQETVSLDGPGTYYAYVIGQAAGLYGVGVYGFIADFAPMGQATPVPLPTSITLLLGGIAATLWSVRRNRNCRIAHELGLVAGVGAPS